MTDFSERTSTATIGTPQDREAFRYAFTLSSANLQTEASQPIRPYRGITEVGTVAVRQITHISASKSAKTDSRTAHISAKYIRKPWNFVHTSAKSTTSQRKTSSATRKATKKALHPITAMSCIGFRSTASRWTPSGRMLKPC